MGHLMTYSHPASSNYPSWTGSEIGTFMQAVGPEPYSYLQDFGTSNCKVCFTWRPAKF